MVRSAEPLEVEVDSAHNANLHFVPLERRIRGRFSFSRTKIRDAMGLAADWDTDVFPGQRIRIDVDAGTAAIIEPLREPEHTLLREKIERRGKRVAPAVQEFTDVHAATWLFWLKGAVDSGLARVVSGMFPPIMPTPKLSRKYRVADEGGDLATENKDLRAQVAELRAAVGELRQAIGK